MNIFKFEMKMYRRSLLIWAPSIAGGLIFYMMFFPLIMEDSGYMEAIFQSFPDEFLAFFNMDGGLLVTSLMGYYGLTISFIYIPLAVQAALYGISILSVEEREYTADFLLSKPVSRKRIYVFKLLSAFTAIFITFICVVISGYLSLILFAGGTTIDYTGATILFSSMFILQLFFLSLGVLISMLVKKVTSVIAYSMGMGFGLYIISSFGEMLSNNVLKILSPYSHFEPVRILVEHNYDWPLAIISIIFIVVALIGGYFLYQRRNIKAL